MAKNLLFTLLLCTFPFGPNLIFAGNETVPSKNSTLNSDECDAPPPDSFRVVDISSGDVDLAWIPAWVGATHTLVVFLQDVPGGWTNLATYYDIPGSSFTVTGLSPGSYKITNATNCANGETGLRISEVEFKIIELTTAGRMPANPVPVDGCKGINMNVHWAGFRITKIGTGVSNLFEITMSGQVKRVYDNNRIVAVNFLGAWPIDPMFPLSSDNPFRMDDLVNGDPNNLVKIGYLQFYENGPSSVVICQSPTPQPWKPEYSFTALIASNTIFSPTGISVGPGQGSVESSFYNAFKVESPFANNINVLVPQTFTDGEKARIHLLNTNGQLLLNRTFDLQSTQVSFPSDWLLPGVYILQIETGEGVQSFKVVKSE